MDRPVPSAPPGAPAGDDAAHERLLTDQSRRWEAGDRALVEHYLQTQPDLTGRLDVVLDLIYHEFLLRKRLGEQPDVAEYVERFPQLADRVRVQLELDHLISEGLAQPDTFNDLSGEVSAKESPPAPRVVPLPKAADPAPPPAEPGAAPEADSDALPAVAGYEILRELGRGGMGVVYQARHLKLNRVVALKMVRVGHLADPEDLVRFLMEGEVVARIHHPNIVQIYEIGSHNHLPYFALEYIDGGTLTQQLTGKPWPVGRAAALVETLARAMHAAHQQGIIHCDLKPGNILMTADGDPKITDFGLFRQYHASEGMTAPKAIMGTPTYMSPEQAKGLRPQLGPGTDVYALGVILYQLLTGDPPFSGHTPYETLHRVVAEEPRPLSQRRRVPADLETICLKCLRKQPVHRYATAADLAEDLRRFQVGNPIAARPLGPVHRGLRWVRKHPTRVLLLALTVALVVGACAATLLLHAARRSLEEETVRAQQAEAAAQRYAWEEHLAEARAHRLGGAAGQRTAALAAIRQALRLPVPPGRSAAELRDEATACLLLDDVQPVPPADWPADADLVAASAAGDRFARADRHGNVVLGRLDGWAEFTRLPGPARRRPTGLAFSPDGQRLLEQFGNGWGRLWQLAGPGLPGVVDLPASPAAAHAFSADGRWLAAAGPDGFVRILDAATGEEFRAWRPGVLPEHLAFHPTLPRLAVCGGPDVRILDLPQGQVLADLTHRAAVTGVAWHPREPLLAAACGDGKARLWDTQKARLVLAPWEVRSSHARVAFDRAGDRLLTADGHTGRVWEARTGRLLLSADGSANAFRHDDQALVAAAPVHPHGPLAPLALRYIKTGVLRGLPTAQPAARACVSPDGRFLAVAGPSIRLFSADSCEEVAALPVSGRPLLFAATGDLWTAGPDGAHRWPVRVEAATDTLVVGPPQRHAGTVLACSTAGRLLVGKDGRLQAVGDRAVDLAGSDGAKHAALSPDGRWAAAVAPDDAGVIVWEAEKGQRVKTLPLVDATEVDFSPDGRWLGVGGAGLRLLSVGAWEEGLHLPNAGDGFAFSPDGQFLATATGSGQLLVVRIESGEPVARLTVPDCGGLTPQAFGPDGATLLASAADRPVVYAFDLRSLRTGLREMGFEVRLPDYGPRPAPAPPPAHVRVVAE